MNDDLKLAVITGSTRKGRSGGPLVSRWIVDRAKQDGRFGIDWIDLADLNLPSDFDEENYPHVGELGARLKEADAFIVVTSELNHSYPASLKNAIDLYRDEWAGKPVALASYGGNAGGQRAAEHLRQVFPEVAALTVRDTLTFVNYWEKFDEQGQPVDAEGTAGALTRLLDQVEWWARPLKQNRTVDPYRW
ncbi:NADPH-dependent FMN reductase [Salininema proteolyticum]|uniref:NADPH-dependent FMN reductase n=1 Tax=Salininema proteolyticum TaxID=1607685 RepID=A0ABV8U105_9ACTN